MSQRPITDGVHWVGAVDWDRRLFDSLIPLPDGTSYNAYLVRGAAKTALMDTVDPPMTRMLLDNLAGAGRIDYIVHHHAEQDHSGALPAVLERHPEATVVATPKCKGMLVDHLHVPPEKVLAVEDGATLDLGDRTLTFLHTPWVHWPETMCTWLAEDRILFSCDFFGSHLAASELYVTDEAQVYEAAKRYFAEIMYPFRGVIAKNLEKVGALDIGLIAPSHGPIHDRPAFIMDAYREWISETPRNLAVIPYVSMHGSTALMVERLVEGLAARGVRVLQFNLADTDLGKLAISLVDAATIVIGTPTVYAGAHPAAVYAAFLANALRPKARFATLVGSWGWGTKVVEQVTGLLPNLKAEILEPVLCKGKPRQEDFEALDRLAEVIARRHREAGLR